MITKPTTNVSSGAPLLLLFDGNAIIHRAFHALPPLTIRRTGEMVNAVYGFASMLLKVLSEIKPTHWGTAFDRPAPTFRRQMFEQYKAQRPETPDELKSQIRLVHEVTEAFHMPSFEIDGYEADDILATLARQSSRQGADVIIVTGDADMLQVVSPHTRVYYPRRSFSDTKLYDQAGVRERYGLEPVQIADLKALTGDVSDNIPGIRGIGEKTAVKLLAQFGTIQGVYERLGEVTPEKLRVLLEENRVQAFQSKELTTVVTDVPLDFDLDRCKVTAYDRNRVVDLFRTLEFVGLLGRLPQSISAPESPRVKTAVPIATAPRIVNSAATLGELAERLKSAPRVAFDVLTTSRAPMAGTMIGLAFAVTGSETFYIPVGHQGLEQPAQLPLDVVIAAIKPCLENPATMAIAHNGKSDMIVLARHGLRLGCRSMDTMVAGYLLGEKSLAIEPLAFNRLGIEVPPLTDLTGTGARQMPLALAPVDRTAHCAGAAVDAVLKLADALGIDLEQQGLMSLFEQVEMPLVPVLAEMEMTGVALDTSLLSDLSRTMEQDIRRLEAQAYDAVGHQFNINSPQQLGKILFEELRLPVARKTKAGYSTDAAILEELRSAHPIIAPVLEYRQLTKLKSTYLDALPQLVNTGTGRVHTSFNQTATTTGRLSSSDPNLQNIPIRTELGRRIRHAFVAAPGYVLLAADYSQIDLRVLAHLSQDTTLVTGFLSNEDIHTSTAALVFNVPPTQVTSDMRRVAKTVNFGVIYGMSDYGLEQATDLTREQAAQFIDTYFRKYPKVVEYIERTKAQARQAGFVQTVLGRRRYVPEVLSPNRQVREAAERMAVNMPVQGTSADIIKIAMINLHRAMKERAMRSRMTLQVHDELVFETPPDEIPELRALLSDVMPRALKLDVPLKIDIRQGNNWGQME